jgi:hypothetical protein
MAICEFGEGIGKLMSTPKRKRNLLDFEQKREIIDYAMKQSEKN